ncbi:MarC family protein [Methanoculleus taiwanensis]|uniref:MarC family protein n=1 Tax=Methanoculleus taiwanensis TaxID=1550565 RepID=UPI000FFE9032|nr:MarC family protein [Methanoculleus taiwanensis]
MVALPGMKGLAEFALVALASVIAIMNPATTTAVSTALLEDMREPERRMVIFQSVKISLFVLLFFAFTGGFLFSVFSFTVPAFRIAGGILLQLAAVVGAVLVALALSYVGMLYGPHIVSNL